MRLFDGTKDSCPISGVTPTCDMLMMGGEGLFYAAWTAVWFVCTPRPALSFRPTCWPGLSATARFLAYALGVTRCGYG